MPLKILKNGYNILRTGVVIAGVGLILASPVVFVQDNTNEVDIVPEIITQDIKDTLSRIEKTDPQKPVTKKLKRKRGEIQSREGTQIKKFQRDRKIVEFYRDSKKVDIGLPQQFNNSSNKIFEDKIVYKSKTPQC